jgi:release factor glutamine methyltransferase
LKNCKGVQGWGFDVSKQALLVAKENAKLNDVAANFERSDLFENVMEKFDVIVSNPPYIPTDEIMTLMPEVAQFEPMIALDGREDGLYFYRKIIAGCREFLNPDGMILFEIGCEQGTAVSKMLQDAGFSDVQVIQDLTRHDRVVFGKL